MTTAIPAEQRSRAMSGLPPELAAIMRPELPSLIEEIRAEIRMQIPDYASLQNGPYGRTVVLIVQQALTTFVEKVGAPGAPTVQRDKTFRRFGRFEAYEGRGLDTMEAAFRLGTRMALHRSRKVARRFNLSSGLLLSFADALLVYVDELVEVAREGYLEAKAEMEQGIGTQRRRLLHLILSGSAAPRAALEEVAERVEWPLPGQVTLLAFHAGMAPPRGVFDDTLLLDLDDHQPYALLPGEMTEEVRATLALMPLGTKMAVGLTVPLAEAADSLRWARRALALAESGVLPPGPMVNCADHLVTLLLFADPGLVEALTRQRLTALTELTASQRDRLIRTLRAWLDTRGNAVQMAEQLGLHPQTVRYRMRGLDKTFGDLLADPDDRFAVEIVLRGLELRARQTTRD
ncbi:PucR family transcriptional regulator [Streptomyces polyrhachis]|uniref:PucR family transcriptional regulator n=1 Tax=Streptomyces polyrhachis TaxID=1282885 RepID=A0ABW2GEC3_9ACTN